MANLKQGRCFNCGSILFLDPSMEKGHCIYCDAVFENHLAFTIEENPDSYEFKNEVMEPYTGPNLDPQVKRAPVIHQTPPPKATAKSADKRPQYEFKEREIPDVKADRKVLIIASSILAVVVIAFLATALPMTIRRDAERAEIAEQFAQSIKDISGSSENIEIGKDFIITGQKNDRCIVILHEIKDQAEADRYYEAYRKAKGGEGEDFSLLLVGKEKSFHYGDSEVFDLSE
ncbi:MAG: hypothetical protein Q4P65_04010 [Eubacteriales bacterium]|nr:hypothetical protein [Eubacteriales bacterium]